MQKKSVYRFKIEWASYTLQHEKLCGKENIMLLKFLEMNLAKKKRLAF